MLLKKTIILLAFVALSAAGYSEQKQTFDTTPVDLSDCPPRLRRSESFFGIHFDFHAGKEDKVIGKHFTPEMVEEIIKKVRPDYIQVDCKGHGGCSSYPTQVGNQAGGYTKDILRIWREVTAKHGVALYMHYSGVWDNQACQHHPEWAVIKADGTRSKEKTSVFGPYKDQLLIPQLKELTDIYKVDGYWIDGECWATERDWCDTAIEQFKQQTGFDTVPRKADQPHWYEWSMFCREAFFKYLRHYTDTMHRHNPKIQVCSNWAFSSFIPEPVTVNLDFLSGDFPLQDSVREGRFEARCLRHQGKPWDLMAWSFSATWPDMAARVTKSPIQLSREAAVVMACGGGFQAYYTQNRDGSIRDWQMNVMSEVATFCRQRQKLCHKAQTVPQIALVYSRDGLYKRDCPVLLHPNNYMNSIKGILFALLENQYHVDITMDHHLTNGQSNPYPMIVLPEWEFVSPELKAELLSYVTQGGNLLVIGPKNAMQFKEQLGIDTISEPVKVHKWLHHNGRLCCQYDLWSSVTLKPDATVFDDFYAGPNFRDKQETAASIRKLGKGQIAGVYMNLGDRYYTATTAVVRDWLGLMVSRLLPEPIVEVKGSHMVDVVVNRIEGKLAINLINTAGPHANKNVYMFDEIPPIGPLTVKIRTHSKPAKITCEPEGKKLKYKYKKGIAEVQLPQLGIHDIIVVH